MATINITITYPDGEGAAIIRDLQEHYGKIEDPYGSGNYRDRTAAECRAAFAASCSNSLLHLCRKVRQDRRNAIQPEADPTIT